MWGHIGRRCAFEYIIRTRSRRIDQVRSLVDQGRKIAKRSRVLFREDPKSGELREENFPLFHFIVNPKAGKPGRPLEILERLMRVFDFSKQRYVVTITQQRGHAKDIARTWRNDIDGDIAVLVGGDGLMHEFVNGLMSTRKKSAHSLYLKEVNFSKKVWTTLRLLQFRLAPAMA